MADREHPKVHARAGEKRKQPLSPQHEGIDPLTEADTLYPRDGAKSDEKKTTKKAVAKDTSEADEQDTTDQKSADTLQDQKHIEADTRTAEEVNADSDEPSTDEDAAQPEPTTDSKAKTSSTKSK